jgi:hypothetical protein
MSPAAPKPLKIEVEEGVLEWGDGFEAFWKEYPRRVGKHIARLAYMKLKPRTQATYDLLFKGLALHKRTEWAGREATYIPHCSTWLNQQRFRDAEDA